MAGKVLAAVQVADREIELQEFEVPRIGANEGLLRIAACGISGRVTSPDAGDSLKADQLSLYVTDDARADFGNGRILHSHISYLSAPLVSGYLSCPRW